MDEEEQGLEDLQAILGGLSREDCDSLVVKISELMGLIHSPNSSLTSGPVREPLGNSQTPVASTSNTYQPTAQPVLNQENPSQFLLGDPLALLNCHESIPEVLPGANQFVGRSAHPAAMPSSEVPGGLINPREPCAMTSHQSPTPPGIRVRSRDFLMQQSKPSEPSYHPQSLSEYLHHKQRIESSTRQAPPERQSMQTTTLLKPQKTREDVPQGKEAEAQIRSRIGAAQRVTTQQTVNSVPRRSESVIVQQPPPPKSKMGFEGTVQIKDGAMQPLVELVNAKRVAAQPGARETTSVVLSEGRAQQHEIVPPQSIGAPRPSVAQPTPQREMAQGKPSSPSQHGSTVGPSSSQQELPSVIIRTIPLPSSQHVLTCGQVSSSPENPSAAPKPTLVSTEALIRTVFSLPIEQQVIISYQLPENLQALACSSEELIQLAPPDPASHTNLSHPILSHLLDPLPNGQGDKAAPPNQGLSCETSSSSQMTANESALPQSSPTQKRRARVKRTPLNQKLNMMRNMNVNAAPEPPPSEGVSLENDVKPDEGSEPREPGYHTFNELNKLYETAHDPEIRKNIQLVLGYMKKQSAPPCESLPSSSPQAAVNVEAKAPSPELGNHKKEENPPHVDPEKAKTSTPVHPVARVVSIPVAPSSPCVPEKPLSPSALSMPQLEMDARNEKQRNSSLEKEKLPLITTNRIESQVTDTSETTSICVSSQSSNQLVIKVKKSWKYTDRLKKLFIKSLKRESILFGDALEGRYLPLNKLKKPASDEINDQGNPRSPDTPSIEDVSKRIEALKRRYQIREFKILLENIPPDKISEILHHEVEENDMELKRRKMSESLTLERTCLPLLKSPERHGKKRKPSLLEEKRRKYSQHYSLSWKNDKFHQVKKTQILIEELGLALSEDESAEESSTSESNRTQLESTKYTCSPLSQTSHTPLGIKPSKENPSSSFRKKDLETTKSAEGIAPAIKDADGGSSKNQKPDLMRNLTPHSSQISNPTKVSAPRINFYREICDGLSSLEKTDSLKAKKDSEAKPRKPDKKDKRNYQQDRAVHKHENIPKLKYPVVVEERDKKAPPKGALNPTDSRARNPTTNDPPPKGPSSQAASFKEFDLFQDLSFRPTKPRRRSEGSLSKAGVKKVKRCHSDEVILGQAPSAPNSEAVPSRMEEDPPNQPKEAIKEGEIGRDKEASVENENENSIMIISGVKIMGFSLNKKRAQDHSTSSSTACDRSSGSDKENSSPKSFYLERQGAATGTSSLGPVIGYFGDYKLFVVEQVRKSPKTVIPLNDPRMHRSRLSRL